MAEVVEKPLEDQTKEELAATMAKEVQQQDPKPDAVAEIEVNVGGTVYKGANHEEVFEKVKKGLEDTKNALKDRERQIHELKKTPPPLKSPGEVAGMNDEQKTTFYKLLEDKPDEALRFADKIRFGVEDPAAVLQEAKALVDEVKTAKAISEEALKFYAEVPDYAKVATAEVDTAMKDRLLEKGRPFTAENMKLTYLELSTEGKIGKPADPPKEKPKAPPPSAAGGGTGSGKQVTEEDLNNMSKAELKKYMEENGIKVYA